MPVPCHRHAIPQTCYRPQMLLRRTWQSTSCNLMTHRCRRQTCVCVSPAILGHALRLSVGNTRTTLTVHPTRTWCRWTSDRHRPALQGSRQHKWRGFHPTAHHWWSRRTTVCQVEMVHPRSVHPRRRRCLSMHPHFPPPIRGLGNTVSARVVVCPLCYRSMFPPPKALTRYPSIRFRPLARALAPRRQTSATQRLLVFPTEVRACPMVHLDKRCRPLWSTVSSLRQWRVKSLNTPLLPRFRLCPRLRDCKLVHPHHCGMRWEGCASSWVLTIHSSNSRVIPGTLCARLDVYQRLDV